MSDRKWVEVIAGENSSVWDRQNPIEGKFVKMDDDVGPNHSKMYTLKTADGEIGVWGSTVLDDKFQNITVGQYVKIEPLGKVKGQAGKEYWDFAVYYDDNEAEIPDEEMPPDFLKD